MKISPDFNIFFNSFAKCHALSSLDDIINESISIRFLCDEAKVMNAMNNMLSKSDFKVILHSKRANIYYLEKCRVMQKDGCVVYLTQSRDKNLFWNIPVANTTVILLGNGTSITQGAMRLLCGAGVMVGFCGGGSTPLFAGTDIEWLSPENEYRPTAYMQGWMSFGMMNRNGLRQPKCFSRKDADFWSVYGHLMRSFRMKDFMQMMQLWKTLWLFIVTKLKMQPR